MGFSEHLRGSWARPTGVSGGPAALSVGLGELCELQTGSSVEKADGQNCLVCNSLSLRAARRKAHSSRALRIAEDTVSTTKAGSSVTVDTEIESQSRCLGEKSRFFIVPSGRIKHISSTRTRP